MSKLVAPPNTEMVVQVCVNGRPIWRKTVKMKPTLTTQLTDKEYDRVVKAAVEQLDDEVKAFKPKAA